MQKDVTGWVCSLGGNKHSPPSGAFVCVVVFLTVLATLGLSGCAGLIGSASNMNNPLPPSNLNITNVQATSPTTSTSQIVWTTNVAADSAVDYGTSSSYGSSTPVDSTMVTSHQVMLSGMPAGTTYYYQVRSTDSKNNHANSGGHTFKTSGFSISGAITPATGGNGATLTLSGAASATTTANASGAYTFPGLASGSYTVTPSKTGHTFSPASQNVSVNTSNVTGVNFTDGSVAVAPTISTQPVNQTVTAGQTASFSVTATGTAPLGYQWLKNGTNLAGATSSNYTTPATTTSDSGSTFTVLVSNTAGTATSAAATLTVNAAAVTFPVWVSPSLLRVGPTDAPGTIPSISLSGARGEYIDTQIAVQGPAGGLTNVNVAVTDLVGPGGAVISKSNYSLYREYYVAFTAGSPDYGGSNRPLPPGTYPDGLIPFNDPETGAPLAGNGAALQAVPFNLAARENQPIWIDLFIPRGAAITPPGTYTGTISVTSAQGNAVAPITITVWNFELPLVPSEKTFFMIFFAANGNSHTEQTILRHKISPRYVQIADVPSDIANFGMNRTALRTASYGFAPGLGCGSVTAPPTLAQFQAAAALFPPGLALDVYPADEISGCTSVYPLIKQWAANAHAVGAKMVVTMVPDPALYDDGTGTGQPAVDFWTLLPNQWRNFSGVPGAIWSYNTEVQDSYSPKWEIDFLPINFRIHAGFLNQTQGATGLLYWAVDYWQNPSTVWDNPVVSNIYGNFPGDGILIYPGTQVGTQAPAPSMRLKWLRDGIQDYEYVQMLKNLGQAPFGSSVIQPIAATWANWTQDQSQFEAARLQLGQKIDSLFPH